MAPTTLRARAIRAHQDDLDQARIWRTPILLDPFFPGAPVCQYGIRGVCRAQAARFLDKAAQARLVYANAERMV